MKRLLAVLTVAAGLIAAFAASAAQAATPPEIQHYQNYPGAWTDTYLCPFPVEMSGVDQFTYRYYDSKVVLVDKFRGTATANGITLNRSEDANITYYYDSGIEAWKGLEEGYAYPNGTWILRDQGPITFDSNGDIVSESGSHPIIHGDTTAVCDALTP